MQPMIRIQGNLINRYERRLLDWLCMVMPQWVTSDHLTLFGVFGAVLVFTGYVSGRSNPHYLWPAAFGYVVHWAGDSLDGSLARFRSMSRPRYGYFLDHSVDAVCIILMISGMGLSSYARMDVAFFLIVGYFALSIHVFLKNHVTGNFQLSFMALGPTELRMIFIAVTIWMFFQGPVHFKIGSEIFSIYDGALVVIGTAFLTLFGYNTARMIMRLRAQEGDGRRAVPASAPLSSSVGRQLVMEPPREGRTSSVKASNAF